MPAEPQDAGLSGQQMMLTPQQCTPDTVRQLCIQLDGSNYKDAHALAVAKTLLHLPIPLGWKHALAQGNRSVYIDKRTGLATAAHPSLKAGKQLLKLLRQQYPLQSTSSDITPADTARPGKQAHAPAQEAGTAADTASLPGSQPSTQDATAEAAGTASELPTGAAAAASDAAPDSATGDAPQPDASASAAQADNSASAAQPDSSAGAAQPDASANEAKAPTGQPAASANEAKASTGGSTIEAQASTASLLLTRPPGPSCMLFSSLPSTSLQPSDSVATSYFYDFVADSVCETSPLDTQIVSPPPRQLVQQCGLLPEPLQAIRKLTFYSWWYEDMESNDLTMRVSSASEVGGGLRRHYCTVSFDIENQSFAIRTAADDQELALGSIYAVTSSSGTTVDVWDLYVGATLVILGKRVTLLKADLATAQWNEFHAGRLKKLKKELQEEVQKYRPRAIKASITFDHGSQLYAGGLALKSMVAQIHMLTTDLRQYRPSKADQYEARIGIDVTNNNI